MRYVILIVPVVLFNLKIKEWFEKVWIPGMNVPGMKWITAHPRPSEKLLPRLDKNLALWFVESMREAAAKNRYGCKGALQHFVFKDSTQLAGGPPVLLSFAQSCSPSGKTFVSYAPP